MYNLDTCGFVSLVSELSYSDLTPIRNSYCNTPFIQKQIDYSLNLGSPKISIYESKFIIHKIAYDEVMNILDTYAGPNEMERANTILSNTTISNINLDGTGIYNPILSQKIQYNDVIIFNTGKYYGIPTITADMKFIRATKSQGIIYEYIQVPSLSLVGL